MEERSFLSKLFDFSFTQFITTNIVKLIFGLAIFFAAVATIAFIAGGFQINGFAGVLALLFSPLIFLLYVMACRVGLEVVIVIFRIAEHTGKLAEHCDTGKHVDGPDPASPAP